MPTELQRLIYASRWAPEIADSIDETVHRIVTVSIGNNRLVDISGLLLAHEGWFVQVLEGGRPKIAAAMDRIFRDSRHTEVHILSSGSIPSRSFREWNMTATTAGPEVQPFLTELGMVARFDARRLDGGSALRLMLALAEAERSRERAALGLSAA